MSILMPPRTGRNLDSLKPRSGETRLKPHAILLVDDDDAVRRLSAIVLRSAGYVVLEASSASEAARIAESLPEPIHLLVSDVNMPEVSGRELTEAIRILQPTIRVLFVSGETRNAVVQSGRIEELDAFVPKPFSPETLKGKVRALLTDAAVFADGVDENAERPAASLSRA